MYRKPTAIRFAATLASLLCFCAVASATTVTFDTISNGSSVPNGFGGLNWSNWTIEDYSQSPFTYTGYETFDSDGYTHTAYLYGDGNQTVLGTITSGSPIVIDSLLMDAAWRNDVTLTLQGFLHGTLVDSTSLLLDTGYDCTSSSSCTADGMAPASIALGWDVDELQIQGTGGSGGIGTYEFPLAQQSHVVLAALNYSNAPEPRTVLLVFIGVAAILFAKRLLRLRIPAQG